MRLLPPGLHCPPHSHCLWKLFQKRPHSKHFGICRPQVSVTTIQKKHTQTKINKWVWLCSNKTLFTKVGNGTDLVYGHSLSTPGLGKCAAATTCQGLSPSHAWLSYRINGTAQVQDLRLSVHFYGNLSLSIIIILEQRDRKGICLLSTYLSIIQVSSCLGPSAMHPHICTTNCPTPNNIALPVAPKQA